MHERIAREQALVMYFEEMRSLKEISQRLLVPDQTIKSWIGRYKRKYGLYGRREPLKEIAEGKAKFHLLPPLPPITKKQYEKLRLIAATLGLRHQIYPHTTMENCIVI